MEKEKLFMSEAMSSGTAAALTWNSVSFGMEMQSNELNCSPDQLPNCFFNPNWENSLDQSDPFESALSSIVSSPVASNATAIPSGGDSMMIRELIGRLGNICNSGEISPQSYINNNSSNNTSCYSTPLNSPPKLNLSILDSQIRGNLPIPGNNIANHPTLAPFAADPGFAERAARSSCFGSRNFAGLNSQFGLNENELPRRLMPRVESGKLSRVSSNQSMKIAGSQAGVQESNKILPQELAKLSKLSRPSTSENEESSVSEQIPGGDFSTKTQNVNEVNARKRKSVQKGKAKATPTSSTCGSDVKVAAENDESNGKRSKSEDANGNAEKAKEEATGGTKIAGDGNQKQSKENSKPPEPPKDYIHVRARRGQATDSHSLAERVRREKISERMKFLQDLVPGCNKVTGKAVMLDEIINYVQSLQRQVEFLSMKLAIVNPRMELNMDALLSKDIFQVRGSLPHSLYQMDSSAPTFPFGYQSQQGLPLHSGLPNNTEPQFSMNPLNAAALLRNPSMQLPPLDGFGEAASTQAQVLSSIWEDDLQNVVQMGIGQNQPQDFPGSITAHMKVEL